jgi:SRSO17 transposase
MNIEDYIKSGILMDYCLELVTEEERKKVEQLCKEHPEIATELISMQNGLERYAVKKTTWKKEELKKKIWETIDKINKEEENL